ncbi:MAG: hypothetical protein RJA81_2382 [Planctomycetota bacterium]|jgi:uncharacterized protein YceH (UPF0502 family)
MSTGMTRPSIDELPRYNARERRVLGVLIEKGKTTPDYYPMTLVGLVTGCNQKSNRDPVVSYVEEDVEDTLLDLRDKQSAIKVEGVGRVPKFKHNLYERWGVSKAEIAVLGELLLRGPQTEGELRARTERMESTLVDQNALQEVLEPLRERGLVVTLSPPGRKRGVIVSHAFYEDAEMEALRLKFAGSVDDGDDQVSDRASSSGGSSRSELKVEVDQLKELVDSLRNRVESLETDLAKLRSDLGA